MNIKATEADFKVEPHEHVAVSVGRILHVCTVCGALGRTRVSVIWGKAPALTRLDPGAEAQYMREQQS